MKAIFQFTKAMIFAFTISLSFQSVASSSGSYSLVSGPTGGVIRNGWYIYNEGIPTITIQAGADSSCGGTGIFTLPLAPGGGDNMGSHTLRYFYAPDDPKANLWVSRDGVLLGTMCNQDMSYAGSTVTVWEGLLKYDGWTPVVTITSPANNTNTKSEKVIISGSAYDAGGDYKEKCTSISKCSLLAKVTVNGVEAKVSEDTFSAEITLVKGLNTIKAVATDNAGFTSESNTITVLRGDDVGENNSSSNSQNSGAANTNENVGNNSSNSISNRATENPEDNKDAKIDEEFSTSEKVAVGTAAAGATGLGVASFLGYVPYRKIGEFIVGFFVK